jgi:hypothetical protein
MQDYDISDSLDVTHEWTTPIGSIDIYLPDAVRIALVGIMTKCQNVFTGDNYDGTGNEFDTKTYNLFDYSNKKWNENEIRCLQEFEKIASKIIRTYIKKAWNMDENVNIHVRCFGNIQRTHSMRTLPHYHHGWDGVLLHYLTVGDEFKFPTEDQDDTPPPFDNPDSGTLLLLDPRPSIKVPNNNKAKTIKPKIGTTLVTPAYVWHETHGHTRAGVRSALVVNFNIENRNYGILPTKLI